MGKELLFELTRRREAFLRYGKEGTGLFHLETALKDPGKETPFTRRGCSLCCEEYFEQKETKGKKGMRTAGGEKGYTVALEKRGKVVCCPTLS